MSCCILFFEQSFHHGMKRVVNYYGHDLFKPLHVRTRLSTSTRDISNEQTVIAGGVPAAPYRDEELFDLPGGEVFWISIFQKRFPFRLFVQLSQSANPCPVPVVPPQYGQLTHFIRLFALGGKEKYLPHGIKRINLMV